MLLKLKLCLLFLILVEGVFGVDPDKVKSVSVMERDDVILHVDLTNLQKEDQLQWMFNKNNTEMCLADIHKRYNSTSIYDNVDNGRFRGRLKLDSQTGSLTITHMRITDTGLYTLLIISKSKTSYKRFNVTVYAPLPLPVPVISRDSSQCSSSSERSSVCVLLCSVLNVSHVSLSWYKGSSLLSSISVSDLNIRLSLPLEVDYEDTNTYTCVLNNTITNHTQHLHINDVCQCSGLHHNVLVIIAAVIFLLIAAAGLGCLVKYRIVAVKCCQINRQEAHEFCEEEVSSLDRLNKDLRPSSDEMKEDV